MTGLHNHLTFGTYLIHKHACSDRFHLRTLMMLSTLFFRMMLLWWRGNVSYTCLEGKATRKRLLETYIFVCP